MTNRIDHKDCLHEATSSARAACRKAHAAAATAREGALTDLLAAFASKGDDLQFLFFAARHFARVSTSDRFEAAAAVFDYFAPSGDEATDARRRANGYMITTDPYTMVRITLRVAS